MPERRRRSRLGSGLANLAQTGSQIGMSLLENQLATKRQEQVRQAATEQTRLTQLLQELSKLTGDVMSGTREPEQAEALQGQLLQMLGPELGAQFKRDFGQVTPPVRKRVAEIGKEFESAPLNIPEDVPGFARSDFELRTGQKPDETLPEAWRVNTGTQPGDLPSRNFRTETRQQPLLTARIGQLLGMREQAMGQRVPTRIPTVTGPTGEKAEALRFPEELAALSPEARTFRTEATGAEVGRRGVEQAQTEAGLGLPTLKGQARATELLTGEESPAVQQARATGAGRTAATQESARLGVYFSPQHVQARIAEATQKAAMELKAAGDKEHLKLFQEASQAGAQLVPVIDQMRDLTAKLATKESGMAARFRGREQAIGAWLGTDPDARELQSLIERSLRPVAMAMGMREANLSEVEQELARRGIGIGLGITSQERVRALRNLYDLATISPEMIKRVVPTAGVAERSSVMQQLIQQRRTVETKALDAYIQAIKAGDADVEPSYKDPVTGTKMSILSAPPNPNTKKK